MRVSTRKDDGLKESIELLTKAIADSARNTRNLNNNIVDLEDAVRDLHEIIRETAE